jgi:DnaJ-class molecular chaperone
MTPATCYMDRRFRLLALKYHPDINKEDAAKEEFPRICEAYDVLSDRKF